MTEETLDYVVREMTHPEGGFYSTQDADSEGEEGKFFLWDRAEIEALLDPETARAALRYWGVADGPNFEGRSILHVPRDPAEVAAALGVTPERLAELLGRARAALFAHREGRIKPGRDEKVLAGWNGMMLRAFAEASRALGRPDYLKVAERNAGFLLSALIVEGRLLRTWKDGRAKLLGYLEDHAMVVDGLLALHEATLDHRWLDAARRLGGAMVDLFWDPQAEGFFDTGRDHETLVVRPRSLFDSAVPCGSSVAADVLLRLAVLTGTRTSRGGARRRSGRSPPSWGGTRPASGGSWRRWTSTSDRPWRWPICGSTAARPAGSRSWRRCSAGTSPTGSSPGRWRAPGATCRSWPPSGLRPADGLRLRAYACQAPTTEPAELGASWTVAAAGLPRRRPVEAGPPEAIVRPTIPNHHKEETHLCVLREPYSWWRRSCCWARRARPWPRPSSSASRASRSSSTPPSSPTGSRRR